MPWWIWLILALAMLAVLIAGIIYVIIHGLHALQSVQRTGEAVSERMTLMTDTEGTRHPKERPIFTERLRGGRQSIHAGPYKGGRAQAGTS